MVSQNKTMIEDLAIIVIGRNEALHLKDALLSAMTLSCQVLYVDSGSQDKSVAIAREQGVEILELDSRSPFNAARARSEGTRYVIKKWAPVWIQYLDGDCELLPAWIAAGLESLHQEASIAAVCGRLMERDPKKNIWNYLAHLDWNDAPGEVTATGGNMLLRVSALEKVGNWNSSLSSGEEADLCYRLRHVGFSIHRLKANMALHEMDMHGLKDWCKRTQRSGYAYATGYFSKRDDGQGFRSRTLRSILVWGAGYPLLLVWAAVTGNIFLWGIAGICLSLYLGKICVKEYGHRQSVVDAIVYACMCFLAKVPQLLGIMQYLWQQRRRAS